MDTFRETDRNLRPDYRKHAQTTPEYLLVTQERQWAIINQSSSVFVVQEECIKTNINATQTAVNLLRVIMVINWDVF